MADDSNEIRISITLDDGSVREGFARIKQAGDDTGSSLGSAFESAKSSLLGLVAAYISFEAAKKFIEDSISAAEAYETALNNVNKAMSSAGEYSAGASKSFVDLANSIQETTTISATHALTLEALARNYASTNEQARALTKAAIDLGVATGQGADVALQRLGQTLSGTPGRLTKIVPALKELTEYQLRTGDAIAIVAARFKDAASGDVNTYEGSLKRLGNSFESLEISVGQIITQSPAIRTVITFLGQEFQKLAEYLKGVSFEGFFKGFITGAILVGEVINKAIILPIEMIYDVVRTAFDAIREAFQVLIFGFATVASKIASFFSPDSTLAKTLSTFASSSKDVLLDFAAQTDRGLKKIGDTKLSDTLGNDLAALRDKVATAKPFEKLKTDITEAKGSLLDIALATNTVQSSFRNMAAGVTSSMSLLVIESTKQFQSIGAAAIKSLGGGVAQAMAAVGKAAVEGKDIFKAFAGAMISALGGALIQMGSGYIMLGLAREIASYGADATGYQLMGIGAGMAALGGALSAIGGTVSGTSTASTSSSSGSSGAASPSIAAVNPATAAAPVEKQSVTVNIHGSVFDTQATGLRIVELVNEAFNTQGAQVLVK